MKHLVFSLLILTLLISGCPQQPPEPTELPSDFEVNYSSGAMHLEWGAFYFHADASGKATMSNTMGREMEVTEEFTVTEEELLEVYKAVVKNNFFSLSESYEDPFVMDGGWSRISVTANGSTKDVSLSNYYNDQFEAVSNSIAQLVVSNLGPNAFFMNFRGYCDDKKIECAETMNIECFGSDSECITDSYYECEEWSEYCEWDFSGELTPEYCDKLQNRKECITKCATGDCSEELCDTLMFEADGCTNCEPGCCEKCDELSSCSNNSGCEVNWVLPNGGSYEFGGCSNMNLCASSEELCASIDVSAQGYEVAAAVEEDSEKASAYVNLANEFSKLYLEKCG